MSPRQPGTHLDRNRHVDMRGLADIQGEVAVTIGANASGIMQVVSHYASRSLDDVMEAASTDQKVGWQLYMHPDRYVCA
jgi:L-lactate dehydrogenase (cytochrome)